jgi:hypothetical protein
MKSAMIRQIRVIRLQFLRSDKATTPKTVPDFFFATDDTDFIRRIQMKSAMIRQIRVIRVPFLRSDKSTTPKTVPDFFSPQATQILSD